MIDRLSPGLTSRGYKLRIVSIRRLEELKEEIETRHHQGMFDQDFYREWISGFDRFPPNAMPRARSIILVAAARPQRRVVFSWEGRDHSLVIPPTYFEAGTRMKIRRLVSQRLRPAGYRVVPAALPKKLLAVRSGLAEYGRNNLAYIPGMGSFAGLVAFYSDLPAGAEPWREPRMMERCGTCTECRRHCPTGAVPAEGFLLRAERCLTLHNEHPAAVPFPAWVDPSWHNCLVGCLRCQVACPVNRRYLDRFAGTVRFSDRQTLRLLRDPAAGVLPSGLVRKLRRTGLQELLEVLPRNLRVLLAHRGAPT